MDRAIILNINFSARLCLNTLDVLSTGTDQLTNTIRINLDGLDSRRVLAELSHLRNRSSHGLLYFSAPLLGEVDGILEDL